MRLSKDLDGKPIVSVADGRILGKTKDAYFDADLRWLAGLHVGSEGLIRRKSLVIRREDVVLFGVDVVLVKDADVIKDDTELPEAKLWLRHDKLSGRRVDTPGGTKLGVVGDAVLDENGQIVAIALSRVHVEGPLSESHQVPRAAVVDTGTEDSVITVDLAKLEQLVTGDGVAVEKGVLKAEPPEVEAQEPSAMLEEETAVAPAVDPILEEAPVADAGVDEAPESITVDSADIDESE